MSQRSVLLDEAGVEGTTSLPSGFAAPGAGSFQVILVSGALAVAGTSAKDVRRSRDARFFSAFEATRSSSEWSNEEARAPRSDATREAISELRRISGLTWDQLGQLFEVSRRSVHFWASGKPLNAENEQRLQRVLDVVRAGDRGTARATRAALMESTEGNSPFDLLVAQRFDDARAILGRGPGRVRIGRTPLSPEARAARAPLPPEMLVDARHEPVHQDVGRARPARTARNKRRGPS